jgi:hypothetical protein
MAHFPFLRERREVKRKIATRHGSEFKNFPFLESERRGRERKLREFFMLRVKNFIS